MKIVEHFARPRHVWKPLTAGTDNWDGETVKVWDGVWKYLLPLLVTAGLGILAGGLVIVSF
jgi:hypothetical protein